ncbi:MAG TPA: DUF411 domain-containing protein [Stellaceae bacterium]|nr:DUF411 domain-containing protein [Stellaceae bacterium]
MKHAKQTGRDRTRSASSLPGRRAILGALAAGAAGLGTMAFGGWPLHNSGPGAVALAADQPTGTARQVTLYKDPQCGCCEGYADYLRSHGFKVSVVPTHDLPLLDEKYGIPTDLQPCHLSLIDGYIVGGHVPVEVVDRLLRERPEITGITLPGMPLGSPGMSGQKTAPFTIYEITKGARRVYAVV